MISYEITRKNKPTPVYRTVREIVSERRTIPQATINVDALSEALEERRRLKRQQQLADGEKPDTDGHEVPWLPVPAARIGRESALAMSKIGYTKWLDEMVIPRFGKGTFVTLRSNPFVPGRVPDHCYLVIELQEIHYMALLDRETRDPCCVGLLAMNSIVGGDRIPMWYPPAKLRPLQPEEMEIINDLLRNQTHQNSDGSGTNSSASAVGESEGGTGRFPIEEGKKEEGDI